MYVSIEGPHNICMFFTVAINKLTTTNLDQVTLKNNSTIYNFNNHKEDIYIYISG